MTKGGWWYTDFMENELSPLNKMDLRPPTPAGTPFICEFCGQVKTTKVDIIMGENEVLVCGECADKMKEV